MKHLASLTAAAAATLYAGTAFAEKWDMPMAYPATNFHSENAAAFAICVGEATGGNLEIVTHAGGSLFGGNDIKRAVQTGQAGAGASGWGQRLAASSTLTWALVAVAAHPDRALVARAQARERLAPDLPRQGGVEWLKAFTLEWSGLFTLIFMVAVIFFFWRTLKLIPSTACTAATWRWSRCVPRAGSRAWA